MLPLSPAAPAAVAEDTEAAGLKSNAASTRESSPMEKRRKASRPLKASFSELRLNHDTSSTTDLKKSNQFKLTF